ncbi:MAG: 4a-hydroxytetrahydrobiopterin dehydratase [bacterium]|nr:4a-hydroxytetrahydrobiopterin dehydratase [bacterium]
MSDVVKIEDAEVTARLSEIPGWKFKQGKLHREFRFKDFVAAFRFMAAVAKQAEQIGHHPDWRNLYGWVNVDLSTHLVTGVSELDFRLAKAMNQFAAQFGADS